MVTRLPEVHQQAAVTVEQDDSFVGAAKGEAERVGRPLAHGSGEGVVEVAGRDVDPFLGRLVHGDHDFVGAPPGQRLEAFVPPHHR
jgi:hypothetical protein